MLKAILKHIDFLTEQIEILDHEVTERVSTHKVDIERPDSIPGIATRMAEQIISEIGTDVMMLKTIPNCRSNMFMGWFSFGAKRER